MTDTSTPATLVTRDVTDLGDLLDRLREAQTSGRTRSAAWRVAQLTALRRPVEVVHRERPAAEGVAAVGRGPRGDEPGDEAGPRVARDVEVAHLVVRRQCLHLVEPVERAPLSADQRLQLVDVAVAPQPEGLVRGRLLDVGLEGEHAGQRLPAEPHVDDVRPLRQVDAQQHVAARAGRCTGPGAPDHPGGQAGRAVAQPVEDPAQQRVVLEAVAAAAGVDELGGEGRRIEVDLAPGPAVEVLEGDAAGVGRHDRA